MAGAALGIIGGAVGGPIGAAVGSVAGSLLDSIIFRDSQTQKIEGPRVSDIGVQLVNEGAPMLRVWGRTRVGGALLWTFRNPGTGERFREVITKKEEGGKGGGQKTETTTFSYNTDVAIGVSEGEIDDIEKIWANGKLLWQKGGSVRRFNDIAIQKGTETQTIDPVIEAQEGTANTPAFRGVAYFRLQKLQLADFGNAIPQFNALVNRSFTLAEFVTQACSLAGINDIDVDALRNQTFAGYAVAGPQQIRRILEPVVLAYRILDQQRGSTLAFFHRSGEEVVMVDSDDLATSEDDPSNANTVVSIEDKADFNLPREAVVDHVDPLRDYQKGSQVYSIDTATASEQSRTIDLPLAITPTSAQRVAATVLRSVHLERRQASLRLPPKYQHLRENDVVHFGYKGFVYTIRIQTATIGLNGIVEIQGTLISLVTQPEGESLPDPVLDTEVIGIADIINDCEGSITPPPFTEGDSLELQVVDSPALFPSDLENNGFLFGMADGASGTVYPGGTLFIDESQTGTFVVGEPAIDEAALFEVATTTPTGSAGVFDRTNAIDLTIIDGTLEAADDEAEVLRGESMLYVGGELIGFRDVETIDASTLRISHLLRGMFATEDRIVAHAAGTGAAFMDVRLARRIEPPGSVGTQLWLKPVASGGDASAVTAESFTLTARAAKSLAPTDFTGSRDASDDITLSWQRRSKYPGPTFGTAACRLTADESPEEYRLLVFIVSGTVPVDEVVVGSSKSHTYTTSEQTDAGITPGDPLEFEVSQVNTSAGPGLPSERINVP